jgi:hypothetical protein
MDFFMVMFDDGSMLRRKFDSYEDAKGWSVKYLENFPRPSKVTIVRNVVELSSKLVIVNTTETRHAS